MKNTQPPRRPGEVTVSPNYVSIELLREVQPLVYQTKEAAFAEVPRVPAALDDGHTIPSSALGEDLLVKAPRVKTQGWQTLDGQRFAVVLDGITLTETTVKIADPIPDEIDLYVPYDVLSSLSEGVHQIGYEVRVAFGRPGRSSTRAIVIDRSAPGGALLPRIIFPDEVELEGLHLSYLTRRPALDLPAIVSTYKDISPGDTLQFYLCHRWSGLEIEAGAVTRKEGDPEETSFAFAWSDLMRLPLNGVVDAYYQVTDEAGNRSDLSPVAPIHMLLKGVPGHIPAPHVRGANDGVVTSEGMTPDLVIDIPFTSPGPDAGDVLELHFGELTFPPVLLDEDDLSDQSFFTFKIPRPFVLDLISSQDLKSDYTITCAYALTRDFVRCHSDETSIVIRV